MNLKIKVCGLRCQTNIKALVQLKLNYMGFIFFSESARYVGDNFDPEVMRVIPPNIDKVGVFVNENLDSVRSKQDMFGLDIIQLHGDESPEFCRSLKSVGIGVVKAFRLDQNFDFSSLECYNDCADYFLFDTRTKNYGGSGQKFDWQLLQRYKGETPFFLSGGIGPCDVEVLKSLQHPQLFSLDVNSGFESSPAWKEKRWLEKFIEELQGV